MRHVTVIIKQMMLTMCRIRMMRWMYRNCRLCPKILKHVTVNHLQTFFLFSFTQKKNQIFLIYKEIEMDRLQSHIWLMASSYMGKYLRFSSYTVLESPSFSYMTLQPIPSKFSYVWGKFHFLFYQCELSPRIYFKKFLQRYRNKIRWGSTLKWWQKY